MQESIGAMPNIQANEITFPIMPTTSRPYLRRKGDSINEAQEQVATDRFRLVIVRVLLCVAGSMEV